MTFETTGPRRLLLALLALAWLPGCTSPISGVQLDRLNRSLEAKTAIFDPELSLYSPFDLDVTELYLEAAREELTAVRRLFEVQIAEPVVIYLFPQDDPQGNRVDQGGFTGSVQALARGSREVVVYLDITRPNRTPEALATFRRNVRHEFAHVAITISGHDPPAWLHEGIAEEVESRGYRNGVLIPNIIPENLVGAHILPRSRRDLAALMRWKEGLDPAADSRWLAHSLVRFLMAETYPEVPFAQTVRQIMQTKPWSLLTEESEWNAWVEALDIDDRIIQAGFGGNAWQRVEAARRLEWLAQHDHAQLLGPRADALAIRFLQDGSTARSAQVYLIGRSEELSGEHVGDLVSAQDPRGYLTGQAVLAHRGTPPDLVKVRHLWKSLDDRTRRELVPVEEMFPPRMWSEQDPDVPGEEGSP